MKQECETCNWRESEIGYWSPCPAHAKYDPPTYISEGDGVDLSEPN